MDATSARQNMSVLGYSLRAILLAPMVVAMSALTELTRKPKVLSWTDRRAVERQLQSSGANPAETARAPRRWPRKENVALAVVLVLVVVVAAGVALAPHRAGASPPSVAPCGDEASASETDRCLLKAAVRSTDSTLCQQMRSVERATRCSDAMKVAMEHAQECLGTHPSYARDCLTELAESRQDTLLCELIGDERARAHCLTKAVAGQPAPP